MQNMFSETHICRKHIAHALYRCFNELHSIVYTPFNYSILTFLTISEKTPVYILAYIVPNRKV